MINKGLTIEQKIQEDQYIKPYHYFIERDSSNGNRYFSYIDKCKEIIDSYVGKTILDAGCGDGFFVNQLDDNKNEIIGLDYSKRAINFAEAFNKDRRIKFFQGEIENMPFSNEYFDIITNIAVLEHIKSENVQLSLKEISRVLKNDGMFILVLPTHNLKKSKKHFQHFNYKEVEEATKDYFRINKYYGSYNILFKFILRLFDNRFYEIKIISKLLKGGVFYKFFANSPLKLAESMILILTKI